MLKFFERLTNAYPATSALVKVPKLWAFCWQFSAGFRRYLVLLMLISSAVAILELSLFGFMGKLVDWLGASQRATFWAQNKWLLLSMGSVLIIFLPLLKIAGSVIRHQTLMGNLPMAVRWRMHRHLLAQSLEFYQDEFAGRVATKVMQTALATREFMMTLIDVLVYIIVYFASMLLLLGQLNAWLLAPVFVWLILYIILQLTIIPRLKKISQVQAHARSTMTGRIVDAYTNITTVKLFSHTRFEEQYAQDSMQHFMQTVYRQFRWVTGLDISINAINYLLIFAVAALGIGLWQQSHISAGAVAVAVALVLRLSFMSHWVLWEISGLFENIGTIVDGMSMLAKPVTVKDVPHAKPLVVSQGHIEFKAVNFSYQKAPSQFARGNILDNLSLDIQPGEKIGLVGRSGAGKSTLVSTLLRFYDIDSGQILIDGQDISQVAQASLRQHIAVVTQDTALLHRSVRDNILYGRPDATEAEIRQALAGAKADEFIAELQDAKGNHGLDAQVGERGVKLSGGQRQRIAIARVLLKNAPILILDEATSALDSEVESAIQESLNSLMQGKTVIAIAHRLSTIAQMDRLVVLDRGKIVEMGRHDELLKQNGIYAHLWQRQTGGYLADEPFA